MKREEVAINETGVSIFGELVGFTPRICDFEKVLKGESARSLAPLNGRQLRILDAYGLSWLIDLQFETVLWLHVLLAPLGHRRNDDHDPKEVFVGKLRIGQYTVQRPFSCETAQIIREVKIPGIGLDFVPCEKRICAVLVAFTRNEKTSDAARN